MTSIKKFASSAEPMIREGARGNAVKELQQKLKDAGINPGGLDGDFGPKTQKAVDEFQRKHKLSVDGVVGKQTWAALDKAIGGSKPAAHKPVAHKPAPKPAPKAPAHHPASGGSDKAMDAARSVLGQNIQSLKYHGPLAKYLDKWPSDHVCCANFVSACLQDAGQIKASQHSDSVAGLAHNLNNDKQWGRVSLKNAKPGDVVCFDVPGEGHYAHVEMFAGWKNGKAQFIGSNNVNRDGSQRISEGHVGYGIDAIYHYKG